MEAPLRALDGGETAPLSPFEQIRYAREILRLEAAAVSGLAARIDTSFCQAVACIYQCKASVIVTGMGKAGLIGQKIAATLASTGTRSHNLHPAEAFHGDLGRIHADDVVLVLSQSGETEEITRLLPSLVEAGVPVLAITRSHENTLAKAADVVLELGPLKEACPLGLAPSTTTTAMLAYGDALALVTSRMRQFSAQDFARFHPGGNLGRKLSKVDEVMRNLDQCRVAKLDDTVRDVLVSAKLPGRRTGAIMVLDRRGRLSGIFTDSDLARLLENRRDIAVDEPIHAVMTADPLTIPSGSLAGDAQAIMAERKISELPVVDSLGLPRGLLDITDLVSRDLWEEDTPSVIPAFPQPDASITPEVESGLPTSEKASTHDDRPA